jgi:hypothetical protein
MQTSQHSHTNTRTHNHLHSPTFTCTHFTFTPYALSNCTHLHALRTRVYYFACLFPLAMDATRAHLLTRDNKMCRCSHRSCHTFSVYLPIHITTPTSSRDHPVNMWLLLHCILSLQCRIVEGWGGLDRAILLMLDGAHFIFSFSLFLFLSFLLIFPPSLPYFHIVEAVMSPVALLGCGVLVLLMSCYW